VLYFSHFTEDAIDSACVLDDWIGDQCKLFFASKQIYGFEASTKVGDCD
jgi:hypothetical protein